MDPTPGCLADMAPLKSFAWKFYTYLFLFKESPLISFISGTSKRGYVSGPEMLGLPGMRNLSEEVGRKRS